MKSLLLAATVVAGLLCSADTADAQLLRGRRATTSYSYPTYSYPMYNYPTYSYGLPSYYNGSVTSSYTPSTINTGVSTASGFTSSNPLMHSGGTYYTYPSYSYPAYNYSTYSYPNYSYPGSYSPGYTYPSGMYLGGQQIWRW